MTSKRVFIVHGRDLSMVAELRHFVQALGLEPFDFVAATSEAGPNAMVRDVVAKAIGACGLVIVLLTPDDVAELKPEFGRESLREQSRPNVYYEAGLAMGLAADRTIFVSVGSGSIPSDLQGTHLVVLDDSPDRRRSLYGKIKSTGIEVRSFEMVADPQTSGRFTPRP